MASTRMKSRGTAQEAGMHRESIGRGLFSTLLWSMAQKLPPNERVKPKERVLGRPTPKNDMTDEQIAECRRAYEAGEKKPAQLAEEFDVSRSRMHAILSYQTRSARADLWKKAA